jgi:hypothetical protein
MGIIATDAASTVSPRRLLAAPLFGRRPAGSPRGIHIDDDLPAIACSGIPASGRRRDQTRSRATARAARNAATAASVVATSTANAANNRDTVGSEAAPPNRSRCARTAATSAKQSPPRATAIATSSSTLPRIVARPGRPPRGQGLRQRGSQTRDPDRLVHHHRSRRRHQRLAAMIDNQPSNCVTLHLRSAFPLGGLETSAIQESPAGQALPCITRRQTLNDMKFRG